MDSAEAGRPKLGAGTIVAALLLPPLGIFLDRGVSRDFWIAFGLTCLGYLPGVAFTFFTLLRPRAVPAAG